MSETEPQFKGPAIAVVVPVHNGAAFLQQCLASLACLLYTSPSPRDRGWSRMPSSA